MKAPIKNRGLTVSDTPRSDDEQRGDFVHIRFARELERENAALRAKLDDPARLHAHCVRHLTEAQVAHLFGERMTEIQNDRDRLQSENAALRELTATLGAPNHVGVPVEQWQALRADKARLDWLDGRPALRLNKIEWSWLHTNDRYGARDIVDALMQEANQ